MPKIEVSLQWRGEGLPMFPHTRVNFNTNPTEKRIRLPRSRSSPIDTLNELGLYYHPCSQQKKTHLALLLTYEHIDTCYQQTIKKEIYHPYCVNMGKHNIYCFVYQLTNSIPNRGNMGSIYISFGGLIRKASKQQEIARSALRFAPSPTRLPRQWV